MHAFLTPFHTLGKIFEIIFPPHEHARVVRETTLETLCRAAVTDRYRESTYLLHYIEPTIRACVHEAKFHNNQKATSLLGAVLNQYLRKLPNKNYMLIPIPLSKRRYRERGHNQVESIIHEAIKDLTHMQIKTDLLVRHKDTQPQTLLKKEARLINMHGAFSIKNIGDLATMHIILIDDVVTTGTTMDAARASLALRHPKSLICIALAH